MTDQTSPTKPQQVLGHAISDEPDVLPLDEARALLDEVAEIHEARAWQFGRSITRKIEEHLRAEFPDADEFTVHPTFDFSPDLAKVKTLLVPGEVKSGKFVVGVIGPDHPVYSLVVDDLSRVSAPKSMRLLIGTGWWDVIEDDPRH